MEEIIRNLFAVLVDLRKAYVELKKVNEKNSTLNIVSDELKDYASAGLHVKTAYEILSKRNAVNIGEAVADEEEAMQDFINNLKKDDLPPCYLLEDDDCCRVDGDGDPTGATEIPDDFYGSYVLDEDEDISSDVMEAIKNGEINPVPQDEEPDLPY